MRRLLLLLAALTVLVGGCGAHAAVTTTSPPPTSTCAAPPGGRCAGDVAWRGPVTLAPDGRTLTAVILCGGTFHATETGDRVTLRLHVGAVRAGGMLCARTLVGVRLSEPLGNRPVYDAVSGHLVRVSEPRD